MQKHYIATAIPYVNAKPHIGTALEFVYADVYARYLRQHGDEVRFVTGTDEHGQKIANTAQERRMTPQEHVDDMSQHFYAALEALGVVSDDFVRTTEERHRDMAQDVWKKLVASGDLEKREYEGLYCVGCEAFKMEKELVDGKCPDHGKEPELIREENYFFKLSGSTDFLLGLYEQQPNFVVPTSRFNEIREMVKGGLEDISVSRSAEKMSWGIPVPGDDSQVMYVWFEALLNYLTAADGRWPADVIFVGKDINRFHSIIFPAVLKAAGLDIPRQIAAHGFITAEGKKMSKSIGNVIDPIEVTEKYGTEPVRYFLMREIPFDRDGDFSDSRFREVYQSELANGIGNLLSRVTNMVEKYFDGKLEADHIDMDSSAYHDAMKTYQFHNAVAVFSAVVSDANELIEQKKPWELAKTDEESLKVVLRSLLGYLKVAGELLEPFMPETAQIIIAAVTAEQVSKSKPLFPRLEE
jgi:methionyl-tRNA synthetase